MAQTKGQETLIDIRTQFEMFEIHMTDSVEIATKKYGMTKTAEVLAEVAHIRERMHKLSILMAALK